jgi:hypothetical protein
MFTRAILSIYREKNILKTFIKAPRFQIVAGALLKGTAAAAATLKTFFAERNTAKTAAEKAAHSIKSALIGGCLKLEH